MKPLSTRIIKSEATYEDLLMQFHEHPEMKCMRDLTISEGVVFFVYKGCTDAAMVIFRGEAFVKPFTMPHETLPDRLYIQSYGPESVF